jgi:molybdopterin converting factor small subunit
MKIKVKLFAQFRHGRFKEKQLEYLAPMEIRQVLDDLGIVADEVGVLMVNSRNVSVDTLLVDGDVLGVFPLVGGG